MPRSRKNESLLSEVVYARVEPRAQKSVEKIADRTDRTPSAVVRLIILRYFKHNDPGFYERFCKKYGITYDPDELLAKRATTP